MVSFLLYVLKGNKITIKGGSEYDFKLLKACINGIGGNIFRFFNLLLIHYGFCSCYKLYSLCIKADSIAVWVPLVILTEHEYDSNDQQTSHVATFPAQ